MDADRFDTLARSLINTHSRRSVLTALVSGTLGNLLTLGALPTGAKKGGKGNGKEGKGRKGNKGRKQKVALCHNGQTIRVSTRALKAHNSHGDTLGPCAASNAPPPGPTCTPACRAGMRCVNGQCVVGQGTCPAGADSCASSGVVDCGLQTEEIPENCQCHISTEGETRCADAFLLKGSTGCGECASSAECASLFPAIAGVFCIKVADNCCSPGTRGHCAAPCPTPPACATPAVCPDTQEACQVRTCRNGLCGRAFAADGTALAAEFQSPGDCRVKVCDGQGDSRNETDDTDVPNDGNECTIDSCSNGTPVHTAQPPGASCNGGAGECDGAGTCVE